jgi:glucose/arabinose dehydrogenase
MTDQDDLVERTGRVIAGLLLPALLLVLLGLVAGCSRGEEERPAPTPTLAPGERRRWGYNPLKATGEKDPPLPSEPLPSGYRVEKLLTGLDRPTQLAVTPDGRLLVTEQPGTVRVVQDGRLLAEPFVSVDVYLPELDRTVELGLVGIAVDPRFAQTGYVYLYYAADNPRRTIVARVRDEGGRGTDLEEILSWEAAPGCCHIGGGMRFAPDGTLFIGVGDHETPRAAQDPLTPQGSILRIDPSGTMLLDNPWVDGGEFDPHVYAYGLRNPYDIAIDPESGRIFAGENGFFGQDAIVEIRRGANYGWPGLFLAVPEAQIEGPLTFYHRLGGIAGMEFYASDVLSELTGRLFYCRFLGGTLHQIEFLADGSVKGETVRARNCNTDITTGPEGFLYFLDYVEGALHRIALDEE